ncbi:MAG: diphthine synthase [Nitrososphaeria archaeon]
MFALVGLGIDGIDSLTLKGIEIFKKSDLIYLDTYTTLIPKDFVSAFSEYIDKEVVSTDRAKLEDELGILLEQAKVKNVTLAVFGDPLFATTHQNFLIEAKKMGIPYIVVHNASIMSVLMTSCGLHPYKFGRVSTIARQMGTPATSVYFTLYDNLMRGMHSIFLLEFDTKNLEGVFPSSAFNLLKDAEKVYKLEAFTEDTLLIVACRIGRKDQEYYIGSVKEVEGIDFGEPPHTIIIPSRLHFTEEEALSFLFNVPKDKLVDNTEKLKRKTDYLVNKYVRRTREVLKFAEEKIQDQSRYRDLFENIECYLDDAIKFLNLGEEQLAMLSVGYAEGLLDSLRLQKILDLKW